MNERNSVFIVHYTCENLFKEDGSSPRITGIVVRNLGSGETKAFSVHLEAERRELGTDPALAADAFDAVEKQLLTDFFELARANKNAKWIHWKMRDPTYGFPAIEHRFRVLKGKPFEIPPSQLIDLSVVVQDIYGPTYTMAHPRLVEFVRLNKITDRDLVPGKEEPQLFKEGKFRALHNSALRKVSVIETIAKKTWTDELKTDSSWQDRHGVGVLGLIEAVQDHYLYRAMIPIFALLGFVLGVKEIAGWVF